MFIPTSKDLKTHLLGISPNLQDKSFKAAKNALKSKSLQSSIM
jgi:hypothetical protein